MVVPEEVRILRLLAMLYRESLSVEQLEDRLGVPRSALLEDIDIIRQAGFRIDLVGDCYRASLLDAIERSA